MREIILQHKESFLVGIGALLLMSLVLAIIIILRMYTKKNTSEKKPEEKKEKKKGKNIGSQKNCLSRWNQSKSIVLYRYT